MFDDAYDRQRRLPEVGDVGQRRLEAASARIVAGDGGLTELAYLVRAGVGRGSVDRSPRAPAFAHAAEFRFEATRAVAAGAWRALSFVRSELDLDARDR